MAAVVYSGAADVLRARSTVMAASRATGQESERVLAVFDFHCADAEKGARLADSLRLKLNRLLRKSKQTRALSGIEMEDAPRIAPAELTPALCGGHLRAIGANVGVWGSLKIKGDAAKLTVFVLDLTRDPTQFDFKQDFSGRGEQFARQIVHPLAERLTGLKVRRPREAGSIPEPKTLGRPLSKNGDFQSGSGFQPNDWDAVDGLTSFWIEDPAGERGKIIKMDTRMSQEQASAWWIRIHEGGNPADAPPPRFTDPPHYNAVAGLHGVHFFSRFYEVKPGMRYRILADYRSGSKKCNMKVFIKGYAEFKQPEFPEKTQRREVWRTYLACRGETGVWHHNSEVFEPSRKTRWIRIIPYAYWPPDEYFWDRVMVVEEPK